MVENLPVMQKTWVRSLVRKIAWRRAWQPTPGFLPEDSHGQMSLEGCSPWGCKELDTTERLTPTPPTHQLITRSGLYGFPLRVRMTAHLDSAIFTAVVFISNSHWKREVPL